MKFRFQPEKSPRVPHHLAGAEIVFEDLGVVLTGLAIWARKDGKAGLFVTFPAQRGKDGSEARYFDYVRSLDETGAWTPWIVGPAYEQAGDFSPDSRWIAYTSDVSGRVEVYVAPLEGGPAAAQWQMSSAGGSEPKFSPDGRTLYYRSAAFQWMAVSVRLMPGKVEAGVPKALFAMPPLELPYLRNLMDVMPDGSGFLTIHPVSTSALSIRVRTGK